MLIKYQDKLPMINPKCIILDGAKIIGNVTLEAGVSVWFNSVIRGDMDKIIIDKNTNIQDLVMIHTDKDYPVTVGKNCSIGHHVVLHGCTIGDNTLIGMNATILNGAKVGDNCIIGANSLVTSNTEIPDYSLAFGNPAKVRRELTDEEINQIKENAVHYQKLSLLY